MSYRVFSVLLDFGFEYYSNSKAVLYAYLPEAGAVEESYQLKRDDATVHHPTRLHYPSPPLDGERALHLLPVLCMVSCYVHYPVMCII